MPEHIAIRSFGHPLDNQMSVETEISGKRIAQDLSIRSQAIELLEASRYRRLSWAHLVLPVANFGLFYWLFSRGESYDPRLFAAIAAAAIVSGILGGSALAECISLNRRLNAVLVLLHGLENRADDTAG